MQGGLQGEALTFRDTVSSLTILMVLAVFVMYVILAILYESYLHPITVLSSLPVALVGGLLTLWLFSEEASLYAFIGMFMLMGIVKKNGIMIVDFAQQRVEQGTRRRRRSTKPAWTLPADHDDHAGRADGRAADRAGLRRRRRFAPAAGAGGRRRADRFAVHHAVRDAGDLSVPRGVPGEGAGPHQLLPFEPRHALAATAHGDAKPSARTTERRAATCRWTILRCNCGALLETRWHREEAIGDREGASDARVLAGVVASATCFCRLHGGAEVCAALGAAASRLQGTDAEDFSETDGWKVAQPSDAALRGKWWEIFGDPQLNALEEQVNISNQNIAAAAANFLAARALVRQARSQYYPTVGGSSEHHECAAVARTVRRNQDGRASSGSSFGFQRRRRSPIIRCRSTPPGSRTSGAACATRCARMSRARRPAPRTLKMCG